MSGTYDCFSGVTPEDVLRAALKLSLELSLELSGEKAHEEGDAS